MDKSDNKIRHIESSYLKEQVSALMDGECQNNELDQALAALRLRDHGNDWEIYHQIGDILNSSELSITMSDDFNTRFNARLSDCASYDASHFAAFTKKSVHFNIKIFSALAATLALVFILVPRFAGNDGAEVGAPYFTGQFMAANYAGKSQVALNDGASSQMAVNTRPVSGSTMLRDPLIDSYLAAHQRYSNSMYSAVEYETGPITQEAGKQ